MSNLSDQIEEIKKSISLSTNKSIAYSSLSLIQEQSGDDPGTIQTLVGATPSLVSLIVADIHDPDEEIGVQALKCLGFMIYHKSLVASISVEGAKSVLDSLVTLITTTKIKSVCNLGVWCVSVQQFNELILSSHFDSLLQAIVHGLDNPFGSLSTTFEASQAAMKLSVQLGDKMRNSSHVWAPPLYRRLLSLDKRERDISERCLLKIVSLLIPPPLNLSKALVRDLKQTLLTGMKDLLNSGMKIQAIRAWGWFIKLLGSYALKNRKLVNEMLKIPEHTFSDHDSQLQVASQFAWEGLIDALVHFAILPQERNVTQENEQFGTSKSLNYDTQENGFSKSVNLIMRPLVGIMQGKFDASVHGSCFNTWHHLLFKLDSAVNCLSVKELVLQHMCEAIFQIVPDCKSIWLWNRTVDLLDDSILANSRKLDKKPSDSACHCLSSTMTCDGASTSVKGLCKQCSIKWLPWQSNHLDLYLKFVHVLVNQMLKPGLTREEESFLSGAALRLFRSVSKGVKTILKRSSTNYDDIRLCLSTMLKFIKNLWEEHSDRIEGDTFRDISLQLIQILIEEIEPAMLGSPLYKMALDLNHLQSQTEANETRHAKIVEMCSINYMDMVLPIVYLTVLQFCIAAQSNFNTFNSENFQKEAQRYCKFMLSSFEPVDTLIVTVRLLYKRTGISYLRLWNVIAKTLVDCFGDMKSISLFKSEGAYFATRDMLCYPFIICYYHEHDLVSSKVNDTLEDSHAPMKRNLELEQVIELWKSMYGSFCSSLYESLTLTNGSEDMCNILDYWLDKYSQIYESTNELESNRKDWNFDLIDLYGCIVIAILEKSQSSLSSQIDNNIGCGLTGIKNSLTLAIRFMKLLQTRRGNDLPTDFGLDSRFYTALAHFLGRLHLTKQDTHSFIEIISSPLLHWLTHIVVQDERANHHFKLVWSETLNCLQRTQPNSVFDSSLLELQSTLLEKTLDHPNPTISKPTVSFWNSTYSNQIKLDYPQCLLHILDKLSRDGKIKLRITTPSFLAKCGYLERSSKEMPSLNMKRKRLELTERQKEVRRAQRGRQGGHGLGGIKTYTDLDFSQGNEDSQESQEVLDFEAILEKFKKR